MSVSQIRDFDWILTSVVGWMSVPDWLETRVVHKYNLIGQGLFFLTGLIRMFDWLGR